MRPTDRKKFEAVMVDARNLIGQGEPYSDGDLDLMFAALMDLELVQIQRALIDHMNGKDGRWRPNPHYIREAMKARASIAWVSADEAWARIPKPGPRASLTDWRGKTVTDYRTGNWPPCLLNQATTEAMALAAPYLEQEPPDVNAARMAFRACYERIVEQEKLANRAPVYRVSGGGTHEERQMLLQQGVEQGLLPISAAPVAGQLEYNPAGQARIAQEMAKIKALVAPKGKE
ncbi:MAG TPA: hypothetical protein VN663_14275 [Ramlibacter sp.]|nr:hypothetical protein [Ramlibacter sp.]